MGQSPNFERKPPARLGLRSLVLGVVMVLSAAAVWVLLIFGFLVVFEAV
jgi:hypothetical protein